MIISLVAAFLVLLISTMNILVASISILCILGIVANVISVMHLKGWSLGVGESIACIMIIGFSVDYVVHLCNHYTESLHDTRYKKMRESLTYVGISIVGGAVTTMGAAIFLFFCKLTFFLQFGILMSSTIGFSLFWSLFVFPSIIVIIGPEGNTGNISYILKRILKCFKNNKK